MSRVDLECIRGDTQAWNITVVKDTVAVDLTDAKLWMTGRRGAGGTLVFQRTELDGIVIDADQDANVGKAVIKLAPTSTSGLAAETVVLFYDIQVLTIDGDLWTVNFGNLTVSPDASLETS